MTQPTHERHPLSAAWGDMEEAAFQDLVEDIKAKGLTDPTIILLDGMILDGWHRYRAVLQAGDVPILTPWDLTDPLFAGHEDPASYVLSRNAHRRHQGKKEIAKCIVRMYEWQPHGVRQSGQDEHSGAKTNQELAEMADASTATVRRAKREVRQERGEEPLPPPTRKEPEPPPPPPEKPKPKRKPRPKKKPAKPRKRRATKKPAPTPPKAQPPEDTKAIIASLEEELHQTREQVEALQERNAILEDSSEHELAREFNAQGELIRTLKASAHEGPAQAGPVQQGEGRPEKEAHSPHQETGEAGRMRSPTVYVVHDTQRLINGQLVSVHDTTPAEAFGRRKVVVGPEGKPWSPLPGVTALVDRMAGYDPMLDYILLIGSPIFIGMAFTMAATKAHEAGLTHIRALVWSSRDREYQEIMLPIRPLFS